MIFSSGMCWKNIITSGITKGELFSDLLIQNIKQLILCHVFGIKQMYYLISIKATPYVNTSVSRRYLHHLASLLLSQIEISEVLSSKDIKPFPHSPPVEREGAEKRGVSLLVGCVSAGCSV